MKKSNAIVPVDIEIRTSVMLPGEIGLFSARPLKRDHIIGRAELLGEVFCPWIQYPSLDKVTRHKVQQYCLQTDEGFYMPPDFNYLSVPWNMNHSCDYNVGFDKDGNFVLAKNVKAGTELTWDYGMGFSNPRFELQCRCNSKKCRKIITGRDCLNVTYRDRNKNYFLRELIKLA